MKKCAIMQPTYLPWYGYFSLIKEVDFFVFLDDVRHSKQSWQVRNKVLIYGNPKWVSVPIDKNLSNNDFLLKNIIIDDSQNWRRRHIESLESSYKKHNYCKSLQFVHDIISDCSITHLSKLNEEIIISIADFLGVKTKFISSSSLGISASRSEKLYLICKELGVDEYVSPPGSQQYLEDDQFSRHTDLKLTYFQYPEVTYQQKNQLTFIPNLSAYDMLANYGTESINLL